MRAKGEVEKEKDRSLVFDFYVGFIRKQATANEGGGQVHGAS